MCDDGPARVRSDCSGLIECVCLSASVYSISRPSPVFWNESHRDCTRHALNATIGSNVYTTIQQVTESFPGSAGVAGLMIPWARILQALYPGHRIQQMAGPQLRDMQHLVIAGVGNLPCTVGAQPGPQHAVAFRKIYNVLRLWDSELPEPTTIDDERLDARLLYTQTAFTVVMAQHDSPEASPQVISLLSHR